MESLLRLGSRLSIWISVFAIGFFSVVQAQESLDTVHLEEITVFGTGITQNDWRYDEFLVSPDQRYIAVIATDISDTSRRWMDIIEVWALDTQSLVTVIDRPFGAAGFGVFAWSPDSSQIAAIISDEELYIWDAMTGELVQTHVGLDIFSNGVRSIAWPQPDTITTVSFEYLVWDLSSDDPPRIFDCHPWGLALWWSPNGRYIATMGDESTLVWICDSQFNRVLSIEGYTTIAWRPDSTEIASVGLYNTLRIWSIASGEAVATSPGGENNILYIDWHPTERFIVTGHLGGELRIWERLTPDSFWLVGDFNISGLNGAAWIGNELITITDTGYIQVWDMIRE